MPADDKEEIALQLERLLDGSTNYYQALRSCVNAATGKVTPVLCTTSRVASSRGAVGGLGLCAARPPRDGECAQCRVGSETMLRMALEGSGNGVREWMRWRCARTFFRA